MSREERGVSALDNLGADRVESGDALSAGPNGDDCKPSVVYFASKSVFLLRMLIHRLTLPSAHVPYLLITDSPSFRGFCFDELVKGGFFAGVAALHSDQLSRGDDLSLSDVLGSHAHGLAGSLDFDSDASFISTHEWDTDFEYLLARSGVTYRSLEISPNQAVEVEVGARKWMTYWRGKDYFEKMRDAGLISFGSAHSVPILDEASSISRTRFSHLDFETWSFRAVLNSLDATRLDALLRFYQFDRRPSDLAGEQLMVRQSSGFAYFPLREACERNPVLGASLGALVDGSKPTDSCKAVVYSDALALDYLGISHRQTWVKGHPRDQVQAADLSAGYYGRARDLGMVPVELLGLVMEREGLKFARGITYGSAGNDSVARMCDRVVGLGQGWQRNLWKVHCLVAAVAFAATIKREPLEIWVRDELVPVVTEMCSRRDRANLTFRPMFEDSEIPDGAFVILDDPGSDETARRVGDIITQERGVLGALVLDVASEWSFPAGMDASLWEMRLLNIQCARNALARDTTEVIHLVSGDPAIRRAFSGWRYSTTLARSQIAVSARRPTTTDRLSMARRLHTSGLIFDLERELGSVEELSALRGDVASFGRVHLAELTAIISGKPELTSDFLMDFLGLVLRSQDDLNDWLDVLSNSPAGVVTCIAARDTIGSHLTENSQQALGNLGITSNLMPPNLWRGYVAVLEGGTALAEHYADEGDEAPVVWDGPIDTSYVHLESAPWRQGDCAICMINGRDVAVNHRGLNFVVFDGRTGSVLDSVAFDTYLPGRDCVRSDHRSAVVARRVGQPED